MMRKFPSVMIDLETLSSDSDAPVIQIGLCAFDIGGVIGPARTILVKPDLRRSPASLSTVVWWMQQDEAARASVARCDKEGLAPDHAIRVMRAFCIDNLDEKFEAWAMPPEFDLTILTNMGRLYEQKMPWAYNRTRDLRTLESLVGASSVERIRPTVAHDAKEDAIAQAKTAIYYRRRCAVN